MPFTPHADVADRYLQHRTAIMRRLERVNRSLAYADEYEANKHLPADLRRPMRAPTFASPNSQAPWFASVGLDVL